MSAIAGPDSAPLTPVRTHRRAQKTHAFKAGGTAVMSGAEASPTTSVAKMLGAVLICLVVALLLNARAVVHDSLAMQDGPVRVITQAVGQAALSFAEATKLTWPRDRLDAWFGHAQQPAVPPLLVYGGPGGNMPGPLAGAGAGAVAGVVATSTAPPRQPTPTVTAPGAAVVARRHGAGADGTPRAVAHHVPPGQPHNPAGQGIGRHPVAPSMPIHQYHPASGLPVIQLAPGRPLRAITASRPLRLLVTGDSLPGYLGPRLIDLAAVVGPVQGFVDIHDGTGLTRPDFVDWSLVAEQQVAADNPDAVVVWIGGNDFQNMTLPNGQFFQAGTPAWTQEYARRVAICMRIWTQGGARRVYWLAMPPARNSSWAYDDAQINRAIQRAAAVVPGGAYLDILGPITDQGRYADFVRDGHGQPILVRESDGVHVNVAGSNIVAHDVLPVIAREWRLGGQAPPPLSPPSSPGLGLAQPTAVAVPSHVLPPVFVTDANAPVHPGSVFHRGTHDLYCWLRNDTLAPAVTSLTFRWQKDLPAKVIDQFPVVRSAHSFTGAFDDAVGKSPGPYECDVLIGSHLLGAAHFDVAR